MPTPPRTNIWPQGELLQLAADAQKVLPRAAAAAASLLRQQARNRWSRRDSHGPERRPNRNDPTRPAHMRPQIPE
ncbi:hypothetical protein NDU88_003134 [Pleurodeles waltl]|uniref:Uncharacterized protein n=1 Tax=Pleurodeles waltl TaxID=8319 RepID=A0AAV7V1K7_PLEWA|nr:hypothetical protein NDU88_003134 [Pleurodeles waltl]